MARLSVALPRQKTSQKVNDEYDLMKMNEMRMMSNECINEYKLMMICSRGCQQVQLICISEGFVCMYTFFFI